MNSDIIANTEREVKEEKATQIMVLNKVIITDNLLFVASVLYFTLSHNNLFTMPFVKIPMGNIEEIDKSLVTYNLQRPNHEEVENLNRLIIIRTLNQ